MHVSLEFSSKQSTSPYSIESNSVLAMQWACMCEFGNSSQRQVSEQKKIRVWVKHQCKTASLQDRKKKPGTHRLERLLHNVLHASDVFKLSTLLEFCVTHGLTMNMSGEGVNETLHGNLPLQPYNCTLCINSFSTMEIVGWGPSFNWCTHKISATGPTQIQDKHKNDHSRERAVVGHGVGPTGGSEPYCFQDTYSCVGRVST